MTAMQFKWNTPIPCSCSRRPDGVVVLSPSCPSHGWPLRARLDAEEREREEEKRYRAKVEGAWLEEKAKAEKQREEDKIRREDDAKRKAFEKLRRQFVDAGLAAEGAGEALRRFGDVVRVKPPTRYAPPVTTPEPEPEDIGERWRRPKREIKLEE